MSDKNTKLVNFEITNAKYCKTGATDATLVSLPGIKSISLDPNSNDFTVRADGTAYFVANSIDDIKVEIVTVAFPESFQTAHAGVGTTTKGGISEHIGTYANEEFDLVFDANTSLGYYRFLIRGLTITGSIQREYKGDNDGLQDAPETYSAIAKGTKPAKGNKPIWKEVYKSGTEGFTELETKVFAPDNQEEVAAG